MPAHLVQVLNDGFKLRMRHREFHKLIRTKSAGAATGFFDDYPRFLSTSQTFATRNRLNERHRALIQENASTLAGKRVLDLASHDGRWSLAALKGGAASVVGIEARAQLVEKAEANMRHYGVPLEQFHFVCGDVFTEINRLSVGSFDIIFCLGFLYHTIHHMWLLQNLARLQPKYLILDTRIDPHSGTKIDLHFESSEVEGCAFASEPRKMLVGEPTRDALHCMLTAAGFRQPHYYDWHRAKVEHWDDLEDYYMGKRVTLVSQAADCPVESV